MNRQILLHSGKASEFFEKVVNFILGKKLRLCGTMSRKSTS